MLGVREVPPPGLIPLDDGNLLPIPGSQKNTIVFEQRDGTSVQPVRGRSATLLLNGRREGRVQKVPVAVFITDARVAIACSTFDKGGGWIGSPTAMIVLNIGSKALAAARRRGKMLVGQVRYPSLAEVSHQRKGALGNLRLSSPTPDGRMFTLDVRVQQPADAPSLAVEIARRAANYRLACDPNLSDEDREILEGLAAGRPVGGDTSRIILPSPWPFGLEGAKLAPLPGTLEIFRECPACRELIRRDADACPRCTADVTPWRLHDGFWWKRDGDEWLWLDESTKRWGRAAQEDPAGESVEAAVVAREPIAAAEFVQAPAYRDCPHCRETMRRDAKACPHCRLVSTPWRLTAASGGNARTKSGCGSTSRRAHGSTRPAGQRIPAERCRRTAMIAGAGATRDCPHCGQSMRRDAGTCPHCRGASDRWRLHQGLWWVKADGDDYWLDEQAREWRKFEPVLDSAGAT